ncbi:MAG TPA: hypothetical protein VI356_07720 [Myxococcales bacterium]
MARTTKPAKKSAGRKAARPLSLAAFFRKLWGQRKQMEQFSTDPIRRRQIVDGSNLSPAHKRLLRRGCMKDIMAELVGVKLSAANSTIIECADEVECGHPECEAFISATRNQV